MCFMTKIDPMERKHERTDLVFNTKKAAFIDDYENFQLIECKINKSAYLASFGTKYRIEFQLWYMI